MAHALDRHLALILLPITLAASTIGLYCVAGTLLWARVLFGIHLTIVHPLLFATGLIATVVTIGTLGFLMAVCFVGSRRAWAIGSALEYPVWLVCGFLVPVSLLPGYLLGVVLKDNQEDRDRLLAYWDGPIRRRGESDALWKRMYELRNVLEDLDAS